ncbi:MAG TPA: hypothetical protein VHI52_22055, partial [Verrucomicrobiae bacterium]|nr:hypothetical protein [Verrucomicrobiae bacterium]
MKGSPIGSPIGGGRLTQGPSRLWTLVLTSRGPERWFAIVEFFTFFKDTSKRHSITLQRPRCRER